MVSVFRSRQTWLTLAALAVVLAFFFAVSHWVSLHQSRAMRLRACLAYGRHTPGPVGKLIAEEARKRGLLIEFSPAVGSEATRQALAAGQIDVAMIRSQVARAEPMIRQVAVASCEALHLFANDGIACAEPHALRGKRIAVGVPGSETRMIVDSVLTFMRLRPGIDFTPVELSAEDCAALPPSDLPDAVFDVGLLPSPRGEALARTCGYRLLALPLGEAMRLRDHAFEDVVIPACAYNVDPPVPRESIRTVGCRLLLVARRDAPAVAIKQLLSVVFESDVARSAGVAPLDPSSISDTLDCPLHAGAIAYLERNQPLIRGRHLRRALSLAISSRKTGPRRRSLPSKPRRTATSSASRAGTGTLRGGVECAGRTVPSIERRGTRASGGRSILRNGEIG